jgi:hypothetical protein
MSKPQIENTFPDINNPKHLFYRYRGKERLESTSHLLEAEEMRSRVTWVPHTAGSVQFTCEAANEAASVPLRTTIRLEVMEAKLTTKEAENSEDNASEMNRSRRKDAVEVEEEKRSYLPLENVAANGEVGKMMVKDSDQSQERKTAPRTNGGARRRRPGAQALAREEKRMMREEEEEDEMPEYDYSHFDYVNQRMKESYMETLLEAGYEEYNYVEVCHVLFLL